MLENFRKVFTEAEQMYFDFAQPETSPTLIKWRVVSPFGNFYTHAETEKKARLNAAHQYAEQFKRDNPTYSIRRYLRSNPRAIKIS
jgi:hypothetical protein